MGEVHAETAERTPLRSLREPLAAADSSLPDRRILPISRRRRPSASRRCTMAGPLSPELIKKMDAYWRAANYLSVGQIYLLDNPLLKELLQLKHVKPRLLGHWGTTPGLNFIYLHCNRLIKEHALNMIYIARPGHGGPGLVANTYLE